MRDFFKLERLIEAFLDTPADEEYAEDSKKFLYREDPVKNIVRKKEMKGKKKNLPSDRVLNRMFRTMKKFTTVKNDRTRMLFILAKIIGRVNAYYLEDEKYKKKFILATPEDKLNGPFGPDTVAVEYLLPIITEQMEHYPEKKYLILKTLHKLGFRSIEEIKEKSPERADRFCIKAILTLYERAKIPVRPKRTARAFEEKRNIPTYMKKKMEYSPFKKYFKYVEYDSTTDLAKVSEVFKDFDAIASEFFGGKKEEEVKLRFRYLGRHRAAGLYYPTVKCLCVDVRHPDAFIHEYFHMTDYQNNNLSEMDDFSPVREKYEEEVLRLHGALGKKEKARIKRSKYNLAYFLQPTEIFARCGEIYIERICKVSNSCVKHGSDKNFAYPENNDLNKLIREYFEKILPERKKQPSERPA